MDDTDLAARLDRSIGPAPDDAPPLTDLLAAGHHVVRRRRLLTAAGSAAAVVVVVGGLAFASSGSPQRASAPIADQPSSTATAATPPPEPIASTPPEPTRAEIGKVMQHSRVGYDTECRLRLGKGTVVQRVDDPYDLESSGGTSIAVELQVGTGLYWYMATCNADGSQNGAWIWSGDARTDFAGWVTESEPTPDTSGGDTGGDTTGEWPGIPDLDLVRFDGDTAALVPEASVTIVDQRAGVDVGSSFAGPGDRTAAAQVSDASGAVYFVLARDTGGAPQYIAVPASEVDGGDLDDFLDLARQRYAEGGGGLL